MRVYKIISALSLIGLLFIGQAQAQDGTKSNSYDGQCYEIVDPYEHFNRAMFQVNLTLDHTILQPASLFYKKTIPTWGRERVSNFVGNLKSPLTLMNNFIQGDIDAAGKTFWRFFINSTFGIGGLVDFAGGFGLTEDQQTFGDSFAHYGVYYGAYLMLPIIGPTTVRDGSGKVFDVTLDPTNLVFTRNEQIAISATNTLVKRTEYLDLSNTLEETSLDYYAAVRSMYIQYRAKRTPGCKPPTIDYNMYNEDANE